MKIISKSKLHYILVISLLITITGIGYSVSQVDYNEIDLLLNKISSYKFNQSLEPLVQLDQILRQIDDPGELEQIEMRMVNLLSSDATLEGKEQICRRIRFIGGSQSVPILLKMLSDDQAFDMAKYAIELNPDPATDKGIIDLLNDGDGQNKVGLINLIGVRKSEDAIPALETYITGEDPILAAASLTALSQMDAEKTVNFFHKNLDSKSGSLQLRMIDACLADAANIEDTQLAITIYREILGKNYPINFRIAALRGIVNLDKAKGTEYVNKAILGDDEQLKSGALSLIKMLPDSKAIDDILSNPSSLNDADQVKLITAIQENQGKQYTNYLLGQTQSKSPEVRATALTAMKYQKDNSVAQFLAQLASEAKGEDKKTARESLYLISGSDTDNMIINSISVENVNLKCEYILAVGKRQIPNSSSKMISLAGSENKKIRNAAIKTLKDVCSEADIDALIQLLLSYDNPADENEISNALSDLVIRPSDPEKRGIQLLEKLDSVSDDNKKVYFYQILGVTGNPNALSVLISALESENNDLQKAAVRGLSSWPNTDPHTALLKVAADAKSEATRILAFRGFLKLLANENDFTESELLSLYKKAFTVAPNTNEKKQIFTGLSRIYTYEAFKVVANYLDDNQLKDEAEVALIRIAWRIIRDNKESVAAVIQRVAESTTNENVKNSALELLRF